MVPSLVIALLASGPPPQHKDTVHELVKEAVAGHSSDGGVDVSRLPFTAESIKQIVLSHQPRIQACYEEHLAQQKKKVPEGILKTRFLITADGYVKDAKVIRAKSAIKDAQLQDCVVAVLSTMEFPKPSNGKSQPVEFPFNLKAQR